MTEECADASSLDDRCCCPHCRRSARHTRRSCGVVTVAAAASASASAAAVDPVVRINRAIAAYVIVVNVVITVATFAFAPIIETPSVTKSPGQYLSVVLPLIECRSTLLLRQIRSWYQHHHPPSRHRQRMVAATATTETKITGPTMMPMPFIPKNTRVPFVMMRK